MIRQLDGSESSGIRFNTSNNEILRISLISTNPVVLPALKDLILQLISQALRRILRGLFSRLRRRRGLRRRRFFGFDLLDIALSAALELKGRERGHQFSRSRFIEIKKKVERPDL